MRIVLWALQSPINIGMILRTAEIYRVPVMLYDEHAVFARKEALETISDFACGALERSPPRFWSDPRGALAALEGRTIATTLSAESDSLPGASLEASDHVLVGNEYDGLPGDIVARCDKRLCIPMPAGFLPKPRSKNPIDPSRSTGTRNDGQPSLNVAVAASIIMYAAMVPSLERRPAPDAR